MHVNIFPDPITPIHQAIGVEEVGKVAFQVAAVAADEDASMACAPHL